MTALPHQRHLVPDPLPLRLAEAARAHAVNIVKPELTRDRMPDVRRVLHMRVVPCAQAEFAQPLLFLGFGHSTRTTI